MNAVDRMKFIHYIKCTVEDDPTLFADVVLAMQQGITDALISERQDASDLAAGLITFVQHDKHHEFPYYHNIQNGLRALYKWFGTAPVWKQIQPLIVDVEE